MPMKRTPLYQTHLSMNARMVDFAGWEMPVQYSGVMEEHINVRENCGLFDVSHMGEILIHGKDAEAFMKKMVPTRIKLFPGKSMYSVFCREDGTAVDDLFIYMIDNLTYYLVVNASNIRKDISWLLSHRTEKVNIVDLSKYTSKIDIQGPASLDVFSGIFDRDRLKKLDRFEFDYFDYYGKNIMISRSGYTGEDGFEIYLSNEVSKKMWDDLCSYGKSYGLKPAGLGARDTLRLEACYSLYGHEISDSITPAEAGLSWVISSAEVYIGKDKLREQKKKGTARNLKSFIIDGRAIPRDGYTVLSEGREVGYVTSGTFSPLLKKGIGLTLLDFNPEEGEEISVRIRDKIHKGIIVNKPFYNYHKSW